MTLPNSLLLSPYPLLYPISLLCACVCLQIEGRGCDSGLGYCAVRICSKGGAYNVSDSSTGKNVYVYSEGRFTASSIAVQVRQFISGGHGVLSEGSWGSVKIMTSN